MPAYDWNQVDPLRRARIADAEAIVKRMNKGESFYDWLHIGEGLAEWRDAALELTGGQELDTPAYRDAFNTARAVYPALAEIAKDKAERSYSIWMWENRQVLEAWHAGLSDKQRRAWNHPRSIWRHSPLGQAAKAAQEPKPARKRASEIDDATNRLHGAVDTIDARLATPGLADLLDLSDPTAAIDTLIAVYGEAVLRDLLVALQARFAPHPKPKATTKKPRTGKVNREPSGERHW